MKNHRLINFAVVALLAVMFLLMVGSIQDDVPIVDEVPHIGAGYSYLVKRDARMNPEHPPLIKDLAAVPLLFLNLNSPFETGAWERGMRDAGQWYFGRDLLFTVGNDPQKIMFWSRLPMILLTLLLGIFIFKWSRELFGNIAALVILALFAFSPTALAHGRFVTTDLGATLGIFASVYFFWRFLKKPSAKNIFWAGIVFGLAQLTKFSVFLIVPFFAGTAAIWIIVQVWQKQIGGSFWGYAGKIIGGLILIGIIGLALVIWPVYQFHVQGYPAEQQFKDAAELLSSFGNRNLANLDLWLVSQPAFRALGQYMLGLLMVVQRAAGGNTTYFLGEVSPTGWWYYFPTVYFLKETLVLHFLTLIALAFCGFKLWRWYKNNRYNHLYSLDKNLHSHFPEFLMLAFIVFYWLYSMGSNLNIGVRHVLPTFPFIFMLVAGQILNLAKALVPRYPAMSRLATRALVILIVLMIFSVVKTYPHFLAYFNESIDGPANGHRYVTDSNLDWGQDLKRLADFVDNPPTGERIEKIKVDYFGWSDPAYYLKNRIEGVRREDENQKGWLAISATFLQTSCPDNAPRCKLEDRTYRWLDRYEPVAKIGYSIFVYNLK